MWLLFVLVADVALPIADRGGGPVLRADLTSKPNDSDATLVDVDITALRFVDQSGKTLWKQPPGDLPAAFPAAKNVVAAYQKNPRASLTTFAYPFAATLMRKNDILVVASAQLHVLRRSDGAHVFHAPVGELGFGGLDFVEAETKITVGGQQCVGRIRQTPSLIECGDRLVYWWTMGIHTFKTAPWTEGGTTMFPDVSAPSSTTHDYAYDLGDIHIQIRPLR